MLTQLTINNFAIIDELEVSFDSGLTVLTGETGAGKSIIIDALDFLFGARASLDLIKTGKEKARVEGMFSVEAQLIAPLQQWFKDNDFEFDGTQIIISREISQNGSKARINGSIANTSHLSFLRSYILDIHEQSGHIELLRLERQTEYIDAFGGQIHLKLLEEYKSRFQDYVNIKNKFNSFKENASVLTKKIELLEFQINEIKKADIVDIDEEEKLKEKKERLLNKKELIESSREIHELIQGGALSVETCHGMSLLTKLKKLIQSCSNHDRSFEPYFATVESITDEIKDLSSFAAKYQEDIHSSEDNLEEIEDRLDLFYKLKKKYGNSLEEIRKYYANISKEHKELTGSSNSIEEIEKEFKEKEKEINLLADKLTKSREKITRDFVNKINEELLTLGFKNVEVLRATPLLVIEFLPCEISENGKEQIQFLFTANPDEPPKPLLKVASGGELSRIMLAIKSIVCRRGVINHASTTMVFDEIDIGISGEIAATIAKKLYKISKSNQVICITHQPIVAAMADKHFVIEKRMINNSTRVTIVDIKEGNREEALALLLTPENKRQGGITDDAKKFAKSLLNNAKTVKGKVLLPTL